jgi:hypothetical protein
LYHYGGSDLVLLRKSCFNTPSLIRMFIWDLEYFFRKSLVCLMCILF